MIKRSHVRYFLAVVEAGSFTRAAAKANVTQPTLSIGIRELERLVQTPLLIRDRRIVRLTEAGASFLPIARDMERAFREADDFGNTIRESPTELRLGTSATISPGLFQCVAAAVADGFTLKIVEGNDPQLYALLADGRIHVALASVDLAGDQHRALPLLQESFALMVSGHHRLAQRSSVAPEELGSELMVARRECEALEATSRFFIRHQVRPRFVLRSADEQRCMALVRAGVGITTAPVSFAGGGVTAIRVDGYDITRTLGLVHSPKQLNAEMAEGLQLAAARIMKELSDPLRGIVPEAYRTADGGKAPVTLDVPLPA